MNSLASIVDELAELENAVIEDAITQTGRIAVIGSPVNTGRFKGNWDVVIDGESFYQGKPSGYDLDGSKTIQGIASNAKLFDIRENKAITLFNNVNEQGGEHYASTVRYDYTQNTANELVETAMITLDQALNRN